MRNDTHHIIWNLYLVELSPRTYRIEMPNIFGIWDRPIPRDGYALSWPVNPHFTGEHSIAALLQETPRFKDARFV